MNTIERIMLIMVISLSIGLILIVYLLPVFIYSYTNFLNLFTSYNGYIFIDFFVLVIISFLCIYFIIRPIKTLNGKKILTIIEMIFGGILVVLPIIGIGILSFNDFLWMYLDGLLLYYLLGLFFFCLLIIPGIILFIHGWYLRKNLRIKNNS